MKKVFLIPFFFTFFFFFQCATEKKIIYSSKEIRKALSAKKISEAKKLEKVILGENRQNQSYALWGLGKYLKSLNKRRKKKPEEETYLKNVNDFLTLVYQEQEDFNLKNLTLLALYNNYPFSKQELLFILVNNLQEETSQNSDVINFSLILAGRLYQEKELLESQLGELCLNFLRQTNTAYFFENALRCYQLSPIFNEATLEEIANLGAYQRITIKKLLNEKNI